MGRSSILVVDDDATILDILRRSLEEAGYDVRTARDGAQAIELHLRRPADVVITDILMPNVEGLETVRRLRRTGPHTKLVAMSGGGAIGPSTYLEVARAMGADATLQKPFETDELLETVAGVLGDRGSGAQSG